VFLAVVETHLRSPMVSRVALDVVYGVLRLVAECSGVDGDVLVMAFLILLLPVFLYLLLNLLVLLIA
jgi:hypothetical protein